MNAPCDSFPFYSEWIRVLHEKLDEDQINRVLNAFYDYAFNGVEHNFVVSAEHYALKYLQSEFRAL